MAEVDLRTLVSQHLFSAEEVAAVERFEQEAAANLREYDPGRNFDWSKFNWIDWLCRMGEGGAKTAVDSHALAKAAAWCGILAPIMQSETGSKKFDALVKEFYYG